MAQEIQEMDTEEQHPHHGTKRTISDTSESLRISDTPEKTHRPTKKQKRGVITKPRPIAELKQVPYFPTTIPLADEKEFLAKVENYFPPHRGTCMVFGKLRNIPRDQVVMGITEYSYSGQMVQTTPWTPVMLRIKKYVEQKWAEISDQPVNFDYGLINGYNPEDSVGAHQDNEPSINQTQPIGSVTFIAPGGTPRPFDLWGTSPITRKIDKSAKWRAILRSRDVIFMRPGVQSEFYHEVPKRKSARGRRYNITFRCVK